MAKILVTGANGAFGALTTRAALAAGHRVAASIRDPNGRNAEASRGLQALGASIVDIDVTSDDSVKRGVDVAINGLGGLDVLVNVAGVGTHGLSEGYTSAQMTQLFDINVVGVHRMIRAAVPTMHAQRAGLVINVSSLLGRLSLPFYGPYSATKFALESLSDTYRAELSQFGVDVLLVEPGGFKTSWIDALVHPEDTGRLAAAYGTFARAPQQAMEGFESLLESHPEQDPARVSDAILALIQTPAGARPHRTVVDFLGMAEPVGMMNALLEEKTHAVYQAFGSDPLLQLKP